MVNYKHDQVVLLNTLDTGRFSEGPHGSLSFLSGNTPLRYSLDSTSQKQKQKQTSRSAGNYMAIAAIRRQDHKKVV